MGVEEDEREVVDFGRRLSGTCRCIAGVDRAATVVESSPVAVQGANQRLRWPEFEKRKEMEKSNGGNVLTW